MNGKLNGGDSISFSAEVDSVIKAGTSFNVLLDNGETIAISTGVSNSNTLSGSLTLTDDSIGTDLLSIQSYTVVDAVDLSGNALASNTLVANFDQVKANSLVIDTIQPKIDIATFTESSGNLLEIKFTESIGNTSEVEAAFKALNIVDSSVSGVWSDATVEGVDVPEMKFSIETNTALTAETNDISIDLTFNDVAGNSTTISEILDIIV